MASNRHHHGPPQPLAPQALCQHYPTQHQEYLLLLNALGQIRPSPAHLKDDKWNTILVIFFVVVLIALVLICWALTYLLGGPSGEAQPGVNLDDATQISTGEWKMAIISVSFEHSLDRFTVSVVNGTRMAIGATSLDALKTSGASGDGLTLEFHDYTDDDKLNVGDWFILNGTDSISDYQIAIYWEASGDKVSRHGEIEQ